MYYLISIKKDYCVLTFKFGSWDCAQKFVDDVLLHGEAKNLSVEVNLVIDDEEEQEEE